MYSFAYYSDLLRNKIPNCARALGRPTVPFACRFFITKLLTCATWDQYLLLRMYDMNLRRKREYLTGPQQVRLRKRLQGTLSPEAHAAIDDKHLFSLRFQAFLGRDWLYLPDSTEEEIRAFLENHELVFLKPTNQYGGHGIRALHRGEYDPEEILRDYAGRNFLLDEAIHQHPKLSEINPTSVNTVRIVTVRKGDRVLPLGCSLRCGRNGAHVDNVTSGGTCYPVDINTGIITGPGGCCTGPETFLFHPGTKIIMPGFQIPHWDYILQMVCKAALLFPTIAYVGWDVAVTEDGAVLVETNSTPAMDFVQMTGPLYKKLRDFVNKN